jgi:hypothetical protein
MSANLGFEGSSNWFRWQRFMNCCCRLVGWLVAWVCCCLQNCFWQCSQEFGFAAATNLVVFPKLGTSVLNGPNRVRTVFISLGFSNGNWVISWVASISHHARNWEQFWQKLWLISSSPWTLMFYLFSIQNCCLNSALVGWLVDCLWTVE